MPKWLLIVIVVILVIFIVTFWCWWLPPWCFPCRWRPCPPTVCPEGSCPAEVAARLVIDDIHTAVWMSIDNEWITDPGADDHWVCDAQDMGGSTPSEKDKFGECFGNYVAGSVYRPGVILQTGLVLDFPTGTFDLLDNVEITTASGGSPTTVTLEEEQFDWLDINTVGQPCPIDPLYAYALFYDDPDNLTPDPAKLQVCTKCDGATVTAANDCSGMGDDPDLSSCLRDRGLHAGMKAVKDLITYWPDPDSLYTVRVHHKTSDLGDYLQEFVFDMCKPVTVDQWNEGCWKKRFIDVTQVRVVYKADPDSDHGGYHEPAMDGGRPGKP